MIDTHINTTPVINVIIPAYNAESFIADCLDSVLSQSGQFELDVIVIDDGSTDATVDIVRRFAAVRWLTQTNQGPAAARNLGLRQSTGQFVAFLDADDLWPKNKVAEQLVVMHRHPDMALVCGDTRQFTAHGDFEKTEFQRSGKDLSYWGHPAYVRCAYQKLLQGNFITTGSVLLRRSCWARTGCFDESLRWVEDLDLWLRVAYHYPIGYLDRVTLLRRRHRHNTSLNRLAMTEAYIRVLHKQIDRHGSALTSMGIRLHPRIAREYIELGQTYRHHRELTSANQAFATAIRYHLTLKAVLLFCLTFVERRMRKFYSLTKARATLIVKTGFVSHDRKRKRS